MTAASPDDVLYGMPAVAEAFGWRTRQAEHLKEKHGLPTFKIGRIVCARRSAVAAWLAEREAAAQRARSPEPGTGAEG